MKDRAVHLNPCTIRGFSLIEILTVLILSTMILSAVIMIYSRIRGSAVAISARLDQEGVPAEILQKIAEDVDRLAAPGFDATITIHNKIDTGYNSAQLIIENRYYDNSQPPQPKIYERVVWQSMYDPLLDQLILYRNHSGLNKEDAVLERTLGQKQKEERANQFVPVCPGLTYFGVYALTDVNEMSPQWEKQAMPNGVMVKLSLRPMLQMEDGSFELPEEAVVSRAVAIDRTRPIAYTISAKLADYSDPNDTKNSDPNTAKTGGKNSTKSR